MNLIIIDKQPQLQWLSIEGAREHCARGASVWDGASSSHGGEPDIVLACAGDVATLETIAAAAWLRKKAPSLRHARRPPHDADLLADECRALLAAHPACIRANFEDMEEIRNLVWPGS